MNRYIKMDDIWDFCVTSPRHAVTPNDLLTLPSVTIGSVDGKTYDMWAEKAYTVIVQHGQSDPQFKLGEDIRYKPSEIRKILEANKEVIMDDLKEDKVYNSYEF